MKLLGVGTSSSCGDRDHLQGTKDGAIYRRHCQTERDRELSRFPNVLTAHVSPPQNATNADKSFEALLSHTIGELSKSDSVYRPNPEETSMVSQSPPQLFSIPAEKRRSGVPSWAGVGGDEERYISGIISELSRQLLIGRSCCFPPLGS